MRKRLHGNKVAGTLNGMLKVFDEVTRRQRKKKLLPEDSDQVNDEVRKILFKGRLRDIKTDLDNGDGKAALGKLEDLREGLERFERRMDGKRK